jgi:hypothetical protein
MKLRIFLFIFGNILATYWQHIGNKSICFITIIKAKTSELLLIQTQGHGFLKTVFSTETWGWDLICNPFSIS